MCFFFVTNEYGYLLISNTSYRTYMVIIAMFLNSDVMAINSCESNKQK